MADKILVVDDESEIRQLIEEILVDEGYEVATAENGTEARRQLEKTRPDLILLDIWMPDIDGISVLKEWQGKDRMTAPVIMMSGHGNVETAVEATRLGAYDYLEKPLSLAKLLLTIKNALNAHRLKTENQRLKHTRTPTPEIIGKSEKITHLREQISRIIDLNTPVLLLGGSGTDKESIARYIHINSKRSTAPFIAVNAATLASEADMAAVFAEAGGGVVFVKDIADLDLQMQTALHRILDQQRPPAVRADSPQQPDARLIAASRKDLKLAADEGSFKDALLFQLNIVPLKIPMLREHYEDVPELLEYYANFFAQSDGLPYRHFSTAAQNRLRHYGWPGNIRELRNLVQRLMILGNAETIELDEVDVVLGEQPARRNADDLSNFDLPLREARENFEKAYLKYQLKQSNGSVSKIARTVGMERTHLYRKLKSLGIDIKS